MVTLKELHERLSKLLETAPPDTPVVITATYGEWADDFELPVYQEKSVWRHDNPTIVIDTNIMTG